jgi:hypothetical protein
MQQAWTSSVRELDARIRAPFVYDTYTAGALAPHDANITRRELRQKEMARNMGPIAAFGVGCAT